MRSRKFYCYTTKYSCSNATNSRLVNPESHKYLGDYIHIYTHAPQTRNAILNLWGHVCIHLAHRFWRFLTALWLCTITGSAMAWHWFFQKDPFCFGKVPLLEEEQSLLQYHTSSQPVSHQYTRYAPYIRQKSTNLVWSYLFSRNMLWGLHNPKTSITFASLTNNCNTL